MAKIELYDLNPFGSELFQDAENYLNELNEQEVDRVSGVTEFILCFPCFEKIDIQTQRDRTYRTRSRSQSRKSQ
jgi:hypothetical protein